MTYIFQYKCRHCGEIVDGPEMGKRLAEAGLRAALYESDFPEGLSGVYSPDQFMFHVCEDGFVGVCEIIGYKKKEVN
jgi:hypothetical protein